MTERRSSLLIRIAVEDGPRAIAALKSVGLAGNKAMAGIERASSPATRAFALFRSGAERVVPALQRLDRGILSTRTLMASLAGGAGIGLLVRNALTLADNLQESAERLGLNVEALQAFRFAADQSGIGAETFDRSIERLNRTLADAREGDREAIKTIADLGLSLTDLEGRATTAGDVLPQLADRIAAAGDAGERTRLAFLAFGKGGGPMVVMLKDGAAGLEASSDQARRAGAVVYAELVAKGAKAKDQLDAIGLALKTSFAEGVLTGFLGDWERFHSLATDPNLRNAVKELGLNLGEAIRPLIENVEPIVRVLGAMKGAALGARLGAIGGPIGAGIGAIAGGAAGALTPEWFDALITSSEEARAAVQALRDELAGLEAELAAAASKKGPGAEFERRGLQARIDDLRLQIMEVEEKARFAAALKRPDGGAKRAGLAPPPAAPGAKARIKEREDERDAVGDFIRALGIETAALRLNEAAREDLEQVMAAQALAMREGTLLTAEQIAAIKALTVEQRALAESAEATAEAERARQATLGEGEQVRLGVRTPAEVLAEEERRLRGLAAAGAIDPTTLERAMAAARAEFEATDSVLGNLKDGARELGLTFASAFEDAIVEGRNLRAIVQGLEQDILRILTRKLVTEPLAGLLSSAVESILGGLGGTSAPAAGTEGMFEAIPMAHAGGIIGETAFPTRALPESLFVAAPRLHAGLVDSLRPGEFPAVLERGEAVISRQVVRELRRIAGPRASAPGRAAAGGPSTIVQNLTISTPDANSFQKSGSQIAADMIAALSRGMRNR